MTTEVTITPAAAALHADLAALRAGIANLAYRDQQFATSLLDQFDRKGALSEKQAPWVAKLAAKASGETPERVKTAIGGLGEINALFDRAKGKLKNPAIVIGGGGWEYRLKVAGPGTTVPGSINVLENPNRRPGENLLIESERPTWYGRILQSGEFEASPRVATPQALIPALQAFAADPATFAGAHAKATGRCCFCNKAIGEGDDPRARAVGYGPHCAENFGLPFPSKGEAKATAAALFNARLRGIAK